MGGLVFSLAACSGEGGLRREGGRDGGGDDFRFDGSFAWDGSDRPDDDDDDDDGFKDRVDNCPTQANPSQTDTDRDGVGDQCDNCPIDANADQLDADADTIGDACENPLFAFNGDNDRDGVLNSVDLCPFKADATNRDSDRDGVGDVCDNCPATANFGQEDSDQNGIGDACPGGEALPSDSDGDGIPDANDNCPGVAGTSQLDTDFDGRGDACDNCVLVANYQQRDTDMDGVGDFCEQVFSDPNGDDDGDLVKNNADNCPTTPNANQADADNDKRGDACDNCPTIANADQAPGPVGSTHGAACPEVDPDGDSDDDGVPDAQDNCDHVANGPGQASGVGNQTDTDLDSVGDACDNCPSIANIGQADTDSDAIGDACERLQTDTDGDGVPDYLDNCPTHGASTSATDTDGDGVGDVCDNCLNVPNASQRDSNNDGQGDRCDNDALPDGTACASGKTVSKLIPPNLYFVIDASLSMEQPACAYDPANCICPAGQTDAEGQDCFNIEASNPLNNDGNPNNNVAPKWVPSRERAWEKALPALSTELASGAYNLGVARFTAVYLANAATCRAQPTQSMNMQVPSGNFGMTFTTAAQLTPTSYTPTAAALEGVLDPVNGDPPAFLLDTDSEPTRNKAVILVTDGLPTTCPNDDARDEDGDIDYDQSGITSPMEMNAALRAAKAIADSDPSGRVRMYVMGFAIGEAERLTMLANAGDPNYAGPYLYCIDSGPYAVTNNCICNSGSGNPSCTPFASVSHSTWYEVGNTASIVAAVQAIAASTLGCTFPLNVTGTTDQETLRINLVNGATRTLIPPAEYTLSGNSIALDPATSCRALRDALVGNPNAHVEAEIACACTSSGAELCDDAIDNDCDSLINEGCFPPEICDVPSSDPNCPDPDCDTNGLEICDGQDNDCDGLIDEGCPPASCQNPEAELCGDTVDNDCDGKIDEDCPPLCLSRPEICNGVDDDCDTMIDEGCGQPGCIPYTEICNGVSDDCDEEIDEFCLRCENPQNEICDRTDNDCDGLIDEGCLIILE